MYLLELWVSTIHSKLFDLFHHSDWCLGNRVSACIVAHPIIQKAIVFLVIYDENNWVIEPLPKNDTRNQTCKIFLGVQNTTTCFCKTDPVPHRYLYDTNKNCSKCLLLTQFACMKSEQLLESWNALIMTHVFIEGNGLVTEIRWLECCSSCGVEYWALDSKAYCQILGDDKKH